jgi:hypothetical protein
MSMNLKQIDQINQSVDPDNSYLLQDRYKNDMSLERSMNPKSLFMSKLEEKSQFLTGENEG